MYGFRLTSFWFIYKGGMKMGDVVLLTATRYGLRRIVSKKSIKSPERTEIRQESALIESTYCELYLKNLSYSSN